MLSLLFFKQHGALANRLCPGLQIRLAQFDSGTHLQNTCPGGEIGRHNGLKIRRFGKTGVPVRFRFRAPILDMTGFFIPWHIFAYFLILEILAAQCGMSF